MRIVGHASCEVIADRSYCWCCRDGDGDEDDDSNDSDNVVGGVSMITATVTAFVGVTAVTVRLASLTHHDGLRSS